MSEMTDLRAMELLTKLRPGFEVDLELMAAASKGCDAIASLSAAKERLALLEKVAEAAREFRGESFLLHDALCNLDGASR